MTYQTWKVTLFISSGNTHSKGYLITDAEKWENTRVSSRRGCINTTHWDMCLEEIQLSLRDSGNAEVDGVLLGFFLHPFRICHTQTGLCVLENTWKLGMVTS
jgi:hypothetical protein